LERHQGAAPTGPESISSVKAMGHAAGIREIPAKAGHGISAGKKSLTWDQDG